MAARGRSRLRVLAGLLGLALYAIALWQLGATRAGLRAEHLVVNAIPMTIHTATGAPPGPAVVIAHGFAGSQQLMQPFAATLARAGYTAISLDFPGHGQHRGPLPGGLANREARNAGLLAALDQAVALGRERGDGRVALLGHSMGSEAVVRYGIAHPEIAAVVAVSLGYDQASATAPRNLLVLTGDLENSRLKQVGLAMVATAGGGATGATYGSLADGTARRTVFVPGVEHIAVLYSPVSMDESLRWLDATFERATPATARDNRGVWLGLLVVSLPPLCWFLAGWLPAGQDIPPARRRPGPWRTGIALLAPALATPLLLRPLPVADLLPIVVGGYLAAHFLVYGLVSLLAGAWLAGWPARPQGLGRGLAQALPTALVTTLVLGVPLHLYVLNYLPTPGRLLILPAVLVALSVYTLGDEWLARRAIGTARAYWATKLLVLVSLAAAIALDPRLFFIALILPVFLLYFLIYGVVSGLAFNRTGRIRVGALANAFAFAWIITVVFPVVR